MDPARRNRLVAALLLTAAFLVATAISLVVLNASHYQTFTLEGDVAADACKHYDAACTCYGTLRVMESYPPQYACDGIEICHDMNRTVCP